jgi:hypothetical protein
MCLIDCFVAVYVWMIGERFLKKDFIQIKDGTCDMLTSDENFNFGFGSFFLTEKAQQMKWALI